MSLNFDVWKITDTDANIAESFTTPQDAAGYLMKNGAIFQSKDQNGIYFACIESGSQYFVQDIPSQLT
jgi:hypothetical protein